MRGAKTLYVPESVRDTSNGLYAVARGPESEVMKEERQIVEELYEVSEKLEHFNKELYHIDPHLKVVLAKPNTTVAGLKPNYYHLIRMVPGHGTYIRTIEDPITGAWRDLDSSVFDIAGEDDLWNDRTQREQRQKARRANEAAQRQRDRESQDRAKEFDERLWSRNNTSVLIPKGVH